jgi:hypothetical protein
MLYFYCSTWSCSLFGLLFVVDVIVLSISMHVCMV